MKGFSAYAKKRIKILSDYLTKFAKNPGYELLHKIRLEIKKIKAILNITEFCVKGFNVHKRYVPYRNIFRRAGEIRQADIVTDLLQLYKIKAPQINRGKPDKLISSFQKELPMFISSIEKKQGKLIESFDKVNQSRFRKYLDLKKDKLRKHLYPRLNLTALHKARKTIKEILYLSPVTKKSRAELDPFYNKLQVLIGQWHDKQIVVMMLDTTKYPVQRKVLSNECRKDIKKIKLLVDQFYRAQ